MNAIRQLAVCAVMVGASWVGVAEGAGKNEGTVNVGGKKAVLKEFAAVPGKLGEEKRIFVLGTMQKVSAEVLKQVGEKGAYDNVDTEVDQVHLKMVFTESGELEVIMGRAGNSSFLKGGAGEAGKATVKDGRIQGEVKLVEEGDFAKEIAVVFDVAISSGGGGEEEKPAKLEPPVKAKVEGKFTGEGKDGKLAFVTVLEEEPFNDKEAIKLVFTEKDPSKSKMVSFDAGFGKLGNALILSVFVKDGKIFGCEVRHSAHEKSGFSAIGDANMEEFSMAGGNVRGHVSTGGEVEAFDQKWEVDLKFEAPLPEVMRAKMAGGEKEQPKKEEKKKGGAEKKREAAKKGPGIPVKSLPLPKDAGEVEYKVLVEQMKFPCDRPVNQVADELAASLKEKGWKEGKGGVRGQKNTIMKYEQGDASLTIFVKPKGKGSEVTMMTEGLDWSGVEKKKGKKDADEDEEDEVNAAVKEALKEVDKALKEVPKGVLDDDDEDEEEDEEDE